MPTGRKLLCEIALAAGAIWAQGAQPAAKPFPPAAPVVMLNVIARDAKDQPVADLNVDDLQVTDQGKQQRVTFFRRNEDSRQLVAALGPHEYSNRSSTGAPHGVAILFDLLNSDLGYRGYGSDEIVRTLQHLESGDQVYLYILTVSGTLYPVHPVPEAGATAANVAANGSWTQQVKPLLDDAMREVTRLKPVDEKLVGIRIESTYNVIEKLGAAMAPLPGRKDIIWISHGVPIVIPQPGRGSYDFTPRLQRLATALDRAGVTINSVDQGNSLATGSKETLELFPGLTGGKAYPERSVETAVPEVLAAPRASYLIEYAAPPPDGKFHKVRVNSARKGVHLQVEQGYFADGEAAGGTGKGSEVPHIPGYREDVFSSPFEAAGIGLWAATSTAAKAPGSVHVEIRVDTRDLLLQPQGDGFSVPLSIVLVAYTAKGQEASVGTSKIALTKAQRDKPSKDDISISQDVPADAVEKLRVIVVDGGSNAMGSLTIPIAGR